MKHTHQYKRVKQKPSGRIIWRCMVVNCQHYTTPEFILNKVSVCPQCKQEFIIDKIARERAFPKCENCRGKKDSKGTLTSSSTASLDIAADILRKFDIV